MRQQETQTGQTNKAGAILAEIEFFLWQILLLLDLV